MILLEPVTEDVEHIAGRLLTCEIKLQDTLHIFPVERLHKLLEFSLRLGLPGAIGGLQCIKERWAVSPVVDPPRGLRLLSREPGRRLCDHDLVKLRHWKKLHCRYAQLL